MRLNPLPRICTIDDQLTLVLAKCVSGDWTTVSPEMIALQLLLTPVALESVYPFNAISTSLSGPTFPPFDVSASSMAMTTVWHSLLVPPSSTASKIFGNPTSTLAVDFSTSKNSDTSAYSCPLSETHSIPGPLLSWLLVPTRKYVRFFFADRREISSMKWTVTLPTP